MTVLRRWKLTKACHHTWAAAINGSPPLPKNTYSLRLLRESQPVGTRGVYKHSSVKPLKLSSRNRSIQDGNASQRFQFGLCIFKKDVCFVPLTTKLFAPPLNVKSENAAGCPLRTMRLERCIDQGMPTTAQNRLWNGFDERRGWLLESVVGRFGALIRHGVAMERRLRISMLQSESEISFQVRWKPRTDEMTKSSALSPGPAPTRAKLI